MSRSQGDLKNNFTDLNNILGHDHVQPQPAIPAENDNKGEHRQVTFFDVAADPILGALNFPASLLYTKHQGIAPNRTTQLFFATENEPAADRVIGQLTGITPTNTALTTNYGMKLPSGLIVNWGFGTCSDPGNLITTAYAVPFLVAGFPTATVYSGVPVNNNSVNIDTSVAPNVANFTVRGIHINQTFYYIAVGV